MSHSLALPSSNARQAGAALRIFDSRPAIPMLMGHPELLMVPIRVEYRPE